MIDEYMSINITIRAFAKEKGIVLSTFESWLTKLRKAGQLGYKRNQIIIRRETLPIDVAKEIKEIVKEESNKSPNIFTLETKGMKLTFSISSLNNCFIKNI